MILNNADNIMCGSTNVNKLMCGSVKIWERTEPAKTYRDIEYIKSTGTQYITTDIIPKYNYIIKFDAKFENQNNSTQTDAFIGIQSESCWFMSAIKPDTIDSYNNSTDVNTDTNSDVDYTKPNEVFTVLCEYYSINPDDYYYFYIPSYLNWQNNEGLAWCMTLYKKENPSYEQSIDLYASSSEQILFTQSGEYGCYFREFEEFKIMYPASNVSWNNRTNNLAGYTPVNLPIPVYSNSNEFINVRSQTELDFYDCFEIKNYENCRCEFYIGNSWSSDMSQNHIIEDIDYTNRNIVQISYPNCMFGSKSCTLTESIVQSEPTVSLTIFGATDTNVSSGAKIFQQKDVYCYGLKIYDENNNLIHNLIPVERVDDSAAGLYDRIENKFYGNMGTGEFVKGPVI